MKTLKTPQQIRQAVEAAIDRQPIIDIHTHLYPPSFGTTLAGRSSRPVDPRGLLLWGIDELLTYHYLVAEVFRVVPASRLPYAQFWQMSKQEQADHIFRHLFLERSPVSEACRGVCTTLLKIGLDPSDRDLSKWRKHFSQQDPDEQIDRCMELANVERLTMTNAVFDDNERQRWLADAKVGADSRFRAVLRIDPILRNWPAAAKKLAEWGYEADEQLSNRAVEAGRRFLRDWIDRMQAIYIAVSLPPEWRYPADQTDLLARAGQKALEQIVLPVCAERSLPFAMMIGSKLQVNLGLGDGGDMVGKSDVLSVAELCRRFDANRFLVTMLSREDQHQLCVAARKFGNLMVFGCWWFLNNPSLVDEITRMRLELLGTSFIPQHSDARVLEQIIYKWDHSKRLIANALADKYSDLAAAGWHVTQEELERDVRHLLRDNFLGFVGRD